MTTYYDLLSLSPQASQEEIRERFRFLAKAYHPDKFSGAAHKKQAEEEFKKINQAYEVLSVSAKRRAYDRSLGFPNTSRPQDSPSLPQLELPSLQSLVRTTAIVLLLYLVFSTALRLGLVSLLVAILLVTGLAYLQYARGRR